ncbi:MAG: hypothetical protein KAH03_05260, partial [Cocleimonas sp.]|nr:hypothetical protein [Cocleimonas sp.]
MNGIFNYHVPGVSSQQCNCTAQDTSPASKDAAKDFKNAMPWENSDSGAGDLLKALYSLLQELVGELNNGGDKPGLTTYAVGEEDGGGLKPP